MLIWTIIRSLAWLKDIESLSDPAVSHPETVLKCYLYQWPLSHFLQDPATRLPTSYPSRHELHTLHTWRGADRPSIGRYFGDTKEINNTEWDGVQHPVTSSNTDEARGRLRENLELTKHLADVSSQREWACKNSWASMDWFWENLDEDHVSFLPNRGDSCKSSLQVKGRGRRKLNCEAAKWQSHTLSTCTHKGPT